MRYENKRKCSRWFSMFALATVTERRKILPPSSFETNSTDGEDSICSIRRQKQYRTACRQHTKIILSSYDASPQRSILRRSDKDGVFFASSGDRYLLNPLKSRTSAAGTEVTFSQQDLTQEICEVVGACGSILFTKKVQLKLNVKMPTYHWATN